MEVWNDPARFKVLILHRKAGKTALAINYLLKEAHKVSGKTFWYVCPTYRQGKDIVWRDPEMLPKFVPPYPDLYQKNEVELSIKVKSRNCEISVKGADKPDSLRGSNPFGVILDEYEMMSPLVWEEIIQPIILAKNEGFVWFIGTPKPQGQHFRKLFEEAKGKKDWFTLHLNAEQSGILTPEQIQYARENMTEAAYRQEYLCEWLESGGAVFRRVDNLIKTYPSEAQVGHDYIIGVDLGKYEDYTVLSVMDKTTHKQVAMERFQDSSWALQEARIEGMARRYNNALLRVEANSIGDPIIENLQRKGLRVEPFLTTSKSKKELIENLVLLMEQGKIWLLADDIQTYELKIFGYEMTEHRNITYSAPCGEYDDTVCALAIACWKLGDLPNREMLLSKEDVYKAEEY